jgi:hypothetical protein
MLETCIIPRASSSTLLPHWCAGLGIVTNTLPRSVWYSCLPFQSYMLSIDSSRRKFICHLPLIASTNSHRLSSYLLHYNSRTREVVCRVCHGFSTASISPGNAALLMSNWVRVIGDGFPLPGHDACAILVSRHPAFLWWQLLCHLCKVWCLTRRRTRDLSLWVTLRHQ